ncbi:K Homology domain-containing protein [Artemisia annua]|uniref:K Homology domain-containing protein n=1 Tax=Artemisia annua TaxID=35608 RepID=A0A2U1NRN0_ARTAN|nr:K Homology domain-containing protein [Artemisia annua]
MADEPQYTTKRKYDDSNAPPPRRVSGFSDAPSYNNVPPPIMDEIQIAKQKAQEIAARLVNSSEPKRTKFDTSFDDSNDLGYTAPPSIPTSYGYGNPSKKIEIPNGRVGVIIGKAGETIKYLQSKSGAKIQVTRDMDQDPSSLTREVELTGSAESIAQAEQLIKEVLAEAESGGSGAVGRRVGGQPGGTEQFQMQIPTKKVGLVIGKGGETIKNMQASTGARIQVIPLHPPPGDTSTERTVQIDGTPEQIEAAKQMVNDVINGQRNSMGSGYSQQGYQAQPPTSWAPPGQQMQQSGYGYPQAGAYPPQYTQQSYASYPQQNQGGYATSWDQSSAQQTTQGGSGYDYYGQQQSQVPAGTGPTDASSAYSYNQQSQGYGQDGYAGYAYAPQSGYDQQSYGNPASGYNVASQTTDGQTGQTAAQGGQADNSNQAPPTSAPQSGYAQQPGSNPSYPPQSGYGVPPTTQPGYGTQPSGYGSYGPPPAQKPPGPAAAQTGYAQPAYGAPPAYATAGYAQPPYGAQQPPAYGGSYGGGYQPPAYSSDATAATAAPASQSQAVQPIPKASPKQN